MTDKRRMWQILHVKETIAGLDFSKAKFKRLRNRIVKGGRVMEGISPERYTAMVLSYYRGYTTDEDVLWHIV